MFPALRDYSASPAHVKKGMQISCKVRSAVLVHLSRNAIITGGLLVSYGFYGVVNFI